MNKNPHFVVFGVLIGAVFGAAMTVLTHRPEMWIPLGIGIGLAVGVGIRDRRNSVAVGPPHKSDLSS